MARRTVVQADASKSPYFTNGTAHKYNKNRTSRVERRTVKEAINNESTDSIPRRFTRGYET